MIAAIIIVKISAAPPVVPHFFHFLHGSRALLIHLIKKSCVCFLAVMLPFHFHLQSFVEHILFRSHDVDNITQCFRCVIGGIHMNMNPAGVVDFRASRTQFAYQFLYGFNIRILTDGGYKFHRVLASRRPGSPTLTSNG